MLVNGAHGHMADECAAFSDTSRTYRRLPALADRAQYPFRQRRRNTRIILLIDRLRPFFAACTRTNVKTPTTSLSPQSTRIAAISATATAGAGGRAPTTTRRGRRFTGFCVQDHQSRGDTAITPASRHVQDTNESSPRAIRRTPSRAGRTDGRDEAPPGQRSGGRSRGDHAKRSNGKRGTRTKAQPGA